MSWPRRGSGEEWSRGQHVAQPTVVRVALAGKEGVDGERAETEVEDHARRRDPELLGRVIEERLRHLDELWKDTTADHGVSRSAVQREPRHDGRSCRV